MRDLRRADPKHTELQSELYDQWKKELRQYWFSLDCKKVGGQKPWSVTAISKMCKTYWQMDRRLLHFGSIHHWMGRLFHLEQKSNSFQHHQKEVECISSAQKSFLENSLHTPWTRREVGLVIFLIADTAHLQTNPPSETNVKRYKPKEVDILKRNTEFVFSCRTGEILQEEQPVTTAVYKAGGDRVRESPQTSSEEKEDPDPVVEAPRDFWSVMEDYKNRDHVAPRTKLHVPKDDFPIPLNYLDVQRETKTSIDVVYEATIDGSWNFLGDRSLSEPWICVTRFELPNKNPPEGHVWVQGRRQDLDNWSRMSKHSCRRAMNKMGGRNN